MTNDAFPPFLYEAYRSTLKRAPRQELIELPRLTITELTSPGETISRVAVEDADLTRNAGTGNEPIGERMICAGRVRDADGAPVPRTLVEVWQANAGGRYRHRNDQEHHPLDPNFIGIGRTVTDDQGRYRFVTIRPGPYPWGNGPNTWRPAHIHFSLFGPEQRSRIITQMYFPGDPLQGLDAIFQSVPASARGRLIARYDHGLTEPNFALGYRWDIVLRGASATPNEAWRA